jgi:hypothetical protein
MESVKKVNEETLELSHTQPVYREDLLREKENLEQSLQRVNDMLAEFEK